MIHGYGGGYGQQTQIRSLLSIEDVRAYAGIMLETHPERHYLERYLSITEEDIVELCKK